MTRLRNLNRRPQRAILRHTTRMLGGARRPPPPDYLALACCALNEALRIRQRLFPYMEEQKQMLEQWRRDRDVEAALRKVYGDDAEDAIPSAPCKAEAIPDAKLILKEEMALAKSRALLVRLRAKLGNKR